MGERTVANLDASSGRFAKKRRKSRLRQKLPTRRLPPNGKRHATKNDGGLDSSNSGCIDLIRHGLAQISAQQLPFAGIAARMVDAQLYREFAARLEQSDHSILLPPRYALSSLCKELGQLRADY